MGEGRLPVLPSASASARADPAILCFHLVGTQLAIETSSRSRGVEPAARRGRAVDAGLLVADAVRPRSNSHRAPDGAVGRGVATRRIDAPSIQSGKSLGRTVS